MTAITLLISKECTVHAVDSLITVQEEKDRYIPDDWDFQKIIRVEGENWGAMSFWGLAKSDFYKWNTPEWLAEQAKKNARLNAQDFANALAEDLQARLKVMKFIDKDGKERLTAKGLGIHFSAYEKIDGRWIPELFLITNWNSLPYVSIDPNKVHVSRETYSVLERAMNKGMMLTNPTAHGENSYRLFVHQYLHMNDSSWLIFNNGDPEMFNSFASGIHQGYKIVARRGGLKDKGSAETYRKLAELPIKLIAQTQTSFCARDTQLVGGRVKNISVEPGKAYASDSGC